MSRVYIAGKEQNAPPIPWATAPGSAWTWPQLKAPPSATMTQAQRAQLLEAILPDERITVPFRNQKAQYHKQQLDSFVLAAAKIKKKSGRMFTCSTTPKGIQIVRRK